MNQQRTKNMMMPKIQDHYRLITHPPKYSFIESEAEIMNEKTEQENNHTHLYSVER